MLYTVGDIVAPEQVEDEAVISAASAEYRLWQAHRLVNGLATDPTGILVKAAFLAPGVSPANATWTPVSWETWVSTVPGGNSYFVRVGIGTGLDIVLPVGIYVPWFQFTDAPTLAVIPAERPIYIR